MSRTVSQLVANEELAKLIRAQRLLDQAEKLYDEVFDSVGAPADAESQQTVFLSSIATCGKKIEMLMGTVVYHDLFLRP